MARMIRIIGTILALTCIGYLVVKQAPNLPPLEVSSPTLWAALAASLLSYCAAHIPTDSECAQITED